MNLAHSFSYKDAVIFGATLFSATFVTMSIRMHSSYINPIFGVKFVIGNGFIDPEHFACKPTFKDTLSKLVKKPKAKFITRLRVNHFRLRYRTNLFLLLAK